MPVLRRGMVVQHLTQVADTETFEVGAQYAACETIDLATAFKDWAAKEGHLDKRGALKPGHAEENLAPLFFDAMTRSGRLKETNKVVAVCIDRRGVTLAEEA